MKRSVAVFLLWMMALVAVQPTLAFHFCGENLYAIGFTAARENRCCCMAEADETGCSAPEQPLSGDGGSVVSEPVESCCSNYIVALSTDDFQAPSGEFAIGEVSVVPPVCYFSGEISGISGRDGLPITQSVFPPGSFVKCHVDLLAFICVFKI
jgi:hypothetical protein